MLLGFAQWKERPVRLGHGEGEEEAEKDTGEGGRGHIQLVRSLDVVPCAMEATAKF